MTICRKPARGLALVAKTGAGRPRKPTALKKLAGNPGKRKLPEDEPEFASAHEVPAAPEWLEPEARVEWARLAPDLHGLGLLPSSSLQVFAGYCQAYAHWVQAEAWMRANGQTIVMRGRDGRVTGVRKAPQSRIANTEREQMRRFASEFGLTPSSSAGMSVPKAASGFAGVSSRRAWPRR